MRLGGGRKGSARADGIDGGSRNPSPLRNVTSTSPRRIEVAGALEVIHDEPPTVSAIHALRELRLPHFELEVDEPARIRDHRVVVAPAEPEDPELDVGGELGAETSEPRALFARAAQTSISSPDAASELRKEAGASGPSVRSEPSRSFTMA